ncbi:MAG: hypothetical protein KR126chlam5_00032 [Candidatus Anoxychlamydiales bacterium]|nr:hypothetical protein [Candidatus Anoxychlamydiales bacterium]
MLFKKNINKSLAQRVFFENFIIFSQKLSIIMKTLRNSLSVETLLKSIYSKFEKIQDPQK